MRALFWNIRGMKKAAGRATFSNILLAKHPDVVCLAEPMVEARSVFPNLDAELKAAKDDQENKLAKDGELLDCIPHILDDLDVRGLEAIPNDQEIKLAIWDLDPDSSPGPDDFSGAFFRHCWELIGFDVCRAVKNFFRLEPFLKESIIASWSSSRKWKVMVTRLSSLLPKLISEEQGTFQKNKVIQSNISLASELANLMFDCTRGGGMRIKIDIRKVFDTVSWSFLFQVLKKFGFPDTWIAWLHQILRSSRISVLLNRGPIGFFGVERGLRQDDIFFFLNGSIRYVRHFNDFLTKYQQFSDQQINLDKSKLFLGKMSLDRKQHISDTLGISICKFPTKYLGVKIFKGRVTREPLLPVMDKIKGRMAGWKGKLLSMVGRVELVRSVISDMPFHNFSVYWWPSSLLNIMERWMQNFIWSGDPETAKGVIINWDSIGKPKQEGGHGIRRLRDVNKALLCKQVWNIKHSTSALSNIINARFLRKNEELKKGYKSSTIWPGLRRMWSLVSH
ncbi:uncharacterized protein LOC122064605 [Macadamia integrifolia]|uniref:uncharacterized protein LOC122064605 n=1 Tax=Macadamia integrifolia TaxID=60698 RepID=UPI001C4E86EC|nr:uncharacterized protein LOC122064605 [Macadamia integrifolia]